MPLPTFSPRTDNADIIHANDVNELQNEVAPIAAATLATRYSTTFTTTGNITLTDASYPIQSFVLDAARSFTLPAISTANHAFCFINRSPSSSTAFIATVLSAGGSTITTISPQRAGIIVPDSTASWASVSGGSYTPPITTASNDVQVGDGSGNWIKKTLAEFVTIIRTVTDWREVLAANRTYYIRTDGNDSNTGLANSSGGAFLTWQKAWDTIIKLDCNGYTVTIQVGDGTYTAGILASIPPLSGNIVINGNSSTPANVLLSVTSSDGIYINCPANITIQNFKIVTTTSGYSVRSANNARITVGTGMNFGASASGHVRIENGYVLSGGNYSITGSAPYHFTLTLNGKLEIGSITITLSGTPNFSSLFVGTDLGSLVSAYAITFSGSATGKRYQADYNSVIQTYGGGANYFPGNSAGTTSAGGQYA